MSFSIVGFAHGGRRSTSVFSRLGSSTSLFLIMQAHHKAVADRGGDLLYSALDSRIDALSAEGEAPSVPSLRVAFVIRLGAWFLHCTRTRDMLKTRFPKTMLCCIRDKKRGVRN